MEAKIYKEVFLGHYNKSHYKTYLSSLHAMKKIATSGKGDIFGKHINVGDIQMISYHYEVLSKLEYYTSQSMAFNLKNLMNIISPEEEAKVKLHSNDIYMPFDNIWIEDYTRETNLQDVQFFSLFLKNPIKVDVLDDDKYEKTDILFCVTGGKSKDSGVLFGNNSFSVFLYNNKLRTIGNSIQIFSPFAFSNNPEVSKHTGAIINDAATDVACLARFCQFLSIKNIHVQSKNFDCLTQRQKRINRLHGGLKYHTLVVSKPGKQYDSFNVNDSEGCMPLHLCRGHLKTYSEEKPLFGKYPGTFYIPAHVRGELKNGVVSKTYSLKG